MAQPESGPAEPGLSTRSGTTLALVWVVAVSVLYLAVRIGGLSLVR